jgi:hypothetical protein
MAGRDGATTGVRPFGDLVSQLSRDIATLIRQDVAVAKAELAEKAGRSLMGVALLCIAALLGPGALAALVAAAILALALTVPTWALRSSSQACWDSSPAFIALLGGTRLEQASPPVPEQTIETLKEDMRWAETRG